MITRFDDTPHFNGFLLIRRTFSGVFVPLLVLNRRGGSFLLQLCFCVLMFGIKTISLQIWSSKFPSFSEGGADLITFCPLEGAVVVQNINISIPVDAGHYLISTELLIAESGRKAEARKIN